MSEKRFIFATNEKWFLFDNETEDFMDMEDCKDKLNEQAEIIRKQSIRIYCQDKEVQRLLGELEKIPKSIREVWLED